MSEWKEDGIRRRDFRATHNGPEVGRNRSKIRRKNTKQWCRGKVGKEHVLYTYTVVMPYHFGGKRVRRGQCKVCGKRLGIRYKRRQKSDEQTN